MFKYIVLFLLLYIAFTINTWLGVVVLVGGMVYLLYKYFPSLYARKGNVAFNEKKYDEAISYYEKAYKTERATPATILTYGILLLRLGKPEEAETIFNILILSKNPKIKSEIKNKAKQYRALTYFKLGRADDAVEEAGLVFDEYKSTVSYGLLCYLKLASNAPFEETYDLCKEAYDYNSDDRDIADNMLVAYLRNNELDKAKEVADLLLQAHPTFTEAYYHSALVYNKLGDSKKAKELLGLIEGNCTRTYLTTVSVEEIEELKNTL